MRSNPRSAVLRRVMIPIVDADPLLCMSHDADDEEEGEEQRREDAVLLQHLLEERDRLRASKAFTRMVPREARAEEPVPRAIPFLPTRGLSQREAKEMCPPGWGLSKDLRRHHRWQIHEKSSGRSFSKAFAASERRSDDSALAFCLCKAWQAHIHEHGGACPSKFDVPLVP